MEVPMVIEGNLLGGTARFADEGMGYIHSESGNLLEVPLPVLELNDIWGEAHALAVSATEYAFLYEMHGEGSSTIRLQLEDDYAIGVLYCFAVCVP